MTTDAHLIHCPLCGDVLTAQPKIAAVKTNTREQAIWVEFLSVMITHRCRDAQ